MQVDDNRPTPPSQTPGQGPQLPLLTQLTSDEKRSPPSPLFSHPSSNASDPSDHNQVSPSTAKAIPLPSHVPARRSKRQTKPRAPLEEEVSSSNEAEEDAADQLKSNEDIHGISAILTAMQKASLVVLSPSWLQDHTTPLLLACRALGCLKGINVQNGITHATWREEGGHSLRLSKDVVIELEKWVELKAHLFLSSDTFREAPGPPLATKPLPILKVDGRLHCTAENCGYCCKQPGAMATHWSEEHKHKRAKKKSKGVKVQTFFRTHPKYFIINSNLSGSPANSPYELYLTQLVPDLEKYCHEVVPYLASEREVLPLLRVMWWHEHLSLYLLRSALL